MGKCGDCKWLASGGGLFQRYYCEYFSTSDKYFYVSLDGSCNKFSLKSTPGNSGYSGGSGSCFLTSACVEYQGKSDDCEELTVLRAFRDGYMQTIEGGAELIKEYYNIAPKIVERIDSLGQKDRYYQYIAEVVKSCVNLIELKKFDTALDEYKRMVSYLAKEFGL